VLVIVMLDTTRDPFHSEGPPSHSAGLAGHPTQVERPRECVYLQLSRIAVCRMEIYRPPTSAIT